MKIGISIGVPKETRADESRVAATPDSVKRLIKLGFDVSVERSAGLAAGFYDAEYQSAGATLVATAEAWAKRIVVKVTPPLEAESSSLKSGTMLISLIEPHKNEALLAKLAQNKVDVLSLEW